jgi:WD40 repeat protein
MQDETLATGQLITTYKGHKGRVNCITWSPNNDGIVVTGGADGTVQFWDSKTGQHKVTNALSQGKAIHALAWSPNQNYIASAHDREILIWYSNKQTLVATYTGHADTVTALSWQNSSNRIASASLDGTVHVWNPQHGKTQFIYKRHTGPVRTVTWAPHDGSIASGGDDRTVRVWIGL